MLFYICRGLCNISNQSSVSGLKLIWPSVSEEGESSWIVTFPSTSTLFCKDVRKLNKLFRVLSEILDLRFSGSVFFFFFSTGSTSHQKLAISCAIWNLLGLMLPSCKATVTVCYSNKQTVTWALGTSVHVVHSFTIELTVQLSCEVLPKIEPEGYVFLSEIFLLLRPSEELSWLNVSDTSSISIM